MKDGDGPVYSNEDVSGRVLGMLAFCCRLQVGLIILCKLNDPRRPRSIISDLIIETPISKHAYGISYFAHSNCSCRASNATRGLYADKTVGEPCPAYNGTPQLQTSSSS